MSRIIARAAGLLRRKTRGDRPPAIRPGLHLELSRQVSGLPRDIGAILIGLGAIGVAIPGPIPSGTPLLAMGLVASFPRLIARLGGPMARRFPKLFRFLVDFVARLRIDLSRRYPECALAA